MARPGVGLNRHVETLCSSQQLHWIQGACYTLEILRAGDSHKKGLFSRSLGFKSVLIHTDTSVNFIYGAIDIIHINSSTPFTLSNNMHLILIGCRYKLLMEWRWSGSGVEMEFAEVVANSFRLFSLCAAVFFFEAVYPGSKVNLMAPCRKR